MPVITAPPPLMPNETQINNLNPSIQLSAESIDKYDHKFAMAFLRDMKTDPFLNLFLLRMRYECEVIQKVALIRNKFQLMSLEDIVNDLASTDNLAIVACKDLEFHKKLFEIVGIFDFFIWWRNQSQILNAYMDNFWKSVGYHTKRYKIIVDIHREILGAINEKNTEQAIDAMERHFSFVVVELLGSLYDNA